MASRWPGAWASSWAARWSNFAKFCWRCFCPSSRHVGTLDCSARVITLELVSLWFEIAFQLSTAACTRRHHQFAHKLLHASCVACSCFCKGSTLPGCRCGHLPPDSRVARRRTLGMAAQRQRQTAQRISNRADMQLHMKMPSDMQQALQSTLRSSTQVQNSETC